MHIIYIHVHVHINLHMYMYNQCQNTRYQQPIYKNACTHSIHHLHVRL